MVSLQQHYCRLARSTTLILAFLLGAAPVHAQLCGEPGRDGQAISDSILNSYFTGSDDASLAAGSRELVLTRARGSYPLLPGDLALLMQVQGATISTRNDRRYGVLASHTLKAEWLRIDRVDGGRVQVKGAGAGGGLLHAYHNQPAGPDHGRARWQLVRVPQFDSLTLDQDVRALPWDGFTGGVLALDVRRGLALAGHALNVDGAGLRGAPAVSLQGALGNPDDWRYSAPNPEDQALGYGHHGSKGEGIAGTPVMIDPQQPGYPEGGMARGAPATAGGGGNAMDMSHRLLASGGGGGNGQPGQAGQPQSGGGLGGHKAPPGPWLGSGGGAAARSVGTGGDGGSGGGLILIRAAAVTGPGALTLRGNPGSAAGKAGGGGGSGGTLWLDMPSDVSLSLKADVSGGAGAAGGGNGGEGQSLSADGREGFPAFPLSGAQAGFRCRPAGHWISGRLFLDNGAADPAQAFNARFDDGEQPVVARQLRLTGVGVRPQTVSTDRQGQFSLRLSEAESRGQFLRLSLTLADEERLPALPVLNRAPAKQQGKQLEWSLTATPDRHSGPLAIGLVTLPQWQGAASQSVPVGGKAVLTFRYHASVSGQVHFTSNSEAVSGLLMDRECSGDSERWQTGSSPGWNVVAGELLCVRVPVAFDGSKRTVTVIARTQPAGAPQGFSLPTQRASTQLNPAH